MSEAPHLGQAGEAEAGAPCRVGVRSPDCRSPVGVWRAHSVPCRPWGRGPCHAWPPVGERGERVGRTGTERVAVRVGRHADPGCHDPSGCP